MISKKKKDLHPKNIMKSGASPQKLRKYRSQTPIWASICTPVAPSLLISSGHSPRLGGPNYRLRGTSSHLGGTAPECPPVALGLHERRESHTINLYTTYHINNMLYMTKLRKSRLCRSNVVCNIKGHRSLIYCQTKHATKKWYFFL